MDKYKIEIMMKVLINGRPAIVNKIRGHKARVRPYGESSRWVEISDLKEQEKNA